MYQDKDVCWVQVDQVHALGSCCAHTWPPAHSHTQLYRRSGLTMGLCPEKPVVKYGKSKTHLTHLTCGPSSTVTEHPLEDSWFPVTTGCLGAVAHCGAVHWETGSLRLIASPGKGLNPKFKM